MTERTNISIDDCCRFYSIETSFVKELNENGLLQLEEMEESYFIKTEDLSLLEKYMHLHYDLEINIPGIEAISHLLQKVEALQTELRSLRG